MYSSGLHTCGRISEHQLLKNAPYRMNKHYSVSLDIYLVLSNQTTLKMKEEQILGTWLKKNSNRWHYALCTSNYIYSMGQVCSAACPLALVPHISIWATQSEPVYSSYALQLGLMHSWENN